MEIKLSKLLLLLIIFSQSINAQVLERYPKGQDFYKGGTQKFYSDIHKILLEKNIQPCENKNEVYDVKFVVYPDSTIKIVKDFDEENINNLSSINKKVLIGWFSRFHISVKVSLGRNCMQLFPPPDCS